MIFTKKSFPILLLVSIVFSSVYVAVTGAEYNVAQSQMPGVEPSAVDTLPATKEFKIKKSTQDTYEEINTSYPMDAPTPDNLKSVVEYDMNSGNYVLRTFVGEMEVSTPFLMTAQEYKNYSAKNEMQSYWQEKNAKASANNEDKFSISDMKFNIGPADKLFGPGGVQIKTQGSAELLMGIKKNSIQNPTLPERMRKTSIFNFDEKIQLNISGSVGDKVSVGLNYNTESSFDFDQKMVKLAFKGKEDDIVKNLEAGNVSMQLNSALITGSTALFGIKTDLQFGKLSVSAIMSQQESETQTVSSKGGAQTTKYEVNVDAYDDNRHFFLGQYFVKSFEKSMSQIPVISSGITISRIEVWVTNKRGSFDESRNIIAFMDLGEGSSDGIENNHWTDNDASDPLPLNRANTLYEEVTGYSGLRDIEQANAVLSSNFSQGNGGEDYEKIESARRLTPSEYTLNPSLGFISLRSALNPDEVLGVAYEYTYGGKTYQVGELSTDAVAPPQALVVKLLKGTAQLPQLKIWDLMMKNVYSLGAMQIQPDNFTLNVVYKNDAIGSDLQYITEGDIKNKLLLKVLNLDRLNNKNEVGSDGKFDYVEGVTALSSTGRIIFPVLEPFGSFLTKAIGDTAIAKKYVFQELYDSTLVVAQEFSEKNKFRIVGEYKASNGSEIRLNAMNVPRGSVSVTAGGAALVENVDYTVDYIMGTVNILNQSLLESGTKIDVKLENQSMFSMQRKSLTGTHLEYKFSDNFTLGGTIMHLSEMPMTIKVNTGNEPISNTIWGMNTSWRTESQWLTNMLDKLPFVEATKPSSLSIDAEYAQLIPGHSKVLGEGGLAYIDDFESTKTTIDIHYPINWRLASTPYNTNTLSETYFSEAALSNNIDYGKNRALLSWYYVDPTLNATKANTATPINLKNNTESQSNHYTRLVPVRELFPYRQDAATEAANMTVMNLSFYPQERGPYNLDATGFNLDGTLKNPTQRWGGIMRKIDATDFETSNIEYIEFWMMDPFIYDENYTNKGGDLYFNLGDISEDILKDGKKSFENGLPIDGDISKADSTVWGVSPRTQSTVMAFDNTPGARVHQDVGLDGLNNDKEFIFPSYASYVDSLKTKISSATLEKWLQDPFSPLSDPAGDNYKFYRGTYYDDLSADILTRYKRFNGTEGNSPDAQNVTENFQTSVSSLPDMEDINSDNTLNEYEKYYQYKISIRRDSMLVGKNRIVDKITSNVKLANGNVEPVSWYQFKIPIRDYNEKIGSIRNFKSIRFIRMFLTNFEKEAHLRFATMDLVRGEWRNFNKQLYLPNPPPISEGQLDVQAVNLEENGDKTPVNYILPPGVLRETDPGQVQLKQNEQSMVMRITNLSPGDARGVYKTTSFDMRQYKRLQMFVHAEKFIEDATNVKDYELACFVRLGSDMTNNYYEYEIPLRLTPEGVYIGSKVSDRQIVWYPENMFDFAFQTLIDAKLKRNVEKGISANVSNLIPYISFDGKNKITVVGNPSISDVQNIMIGIRNVGRDVKSGEIWVNELRMSEFEEGGGWAAMGNLALGLSDLGSVKASGRVETAGYGSLESTVTNRRLDNLYQMNFSTALEVGRFLPKKANFRIPAFYSYSNETVTPKYNPLDQDVLMTDALDIMTNPIQRDSLQLISNAVETNKSFNVTGAKIDIKSKTPQFYDPTNVTFTYAYTEKNQHTAEVEKNLETTERAAINYAFTFDVKPWEPFAKSKVLEKPLFKIIKDFNLNFMPNSIAFNTDMSRQFSQIKLREFSIDGQEPASATENFDLNFSKDFMWNRQFDIKYDLTKSMRFSFQTAMNANIIEPYNTPEIGKEHYEQWRDAVWTSIRKMGSPYTYQQVFSASWSLPINKLPLLDWVNANASYNSTYDWKKMAQLSDGAEVGNIATSMGAWQADGQFNFESLYNKLDYLKKINQRYSSQGRGRKKFQPRTYTETLRFEKGEIKTISHRLGSDRYIATATDKTGATVSFSSKPKNATMLELTPKVDMDSVLLVVTSLDPNELNAPEKITSFLVRSLMMVRRASITYRESNSMVLPGFFPEAGFLGQQLDGNGLYAPGYGFAFGFSDETTINTALENGWLSKSETLINPATTAFTSDLNVTASLEPISGLKIDLNAKRYVADNTTIQFMFPGAPTTFTGSYNITLMALSTAFTPLGNVNTNYQSPLFDNFLANRQIVKNKLDAKYLNTKYPNAGFLENTSLTNFDPNLGGQGASSVGLNSADVLIPSFLAAYTGRDASTMDTNPFLSILKLLPNWRVSYDGFSALEFVKKNFKSISLTHAYSCRYSIGSYTSYSTWVAMGNGDDALGYIRDVQTNNPLPSSPYDISSVSLTEMFSPLLGINAVLKNSMTAKMEYKKQRNLALNLTSTQLIESQTDEYVIGWGYLLKDFDVILKMNNKQTNVKNDLKLSMDLSFKDIKTLLRKVQENITQASSGNKLFTLKIMADYVFSSKINIQLFYDKQATTPLISSAYPISTTNFGVSFKFMLTR